MLLSTGYLYRGDDPSPPDWKRKYILASQARSIWALLGSTVEVQSQHSSPVVEPLRPTSETSLQRSSTTAVPVRNPPGEHVTKESPTLSPSRSHSVLPLHQNHTNGSPSKWQPWTSLIPEHSVARWLREIYHQSETPLSFSYSAVLRDCSVEFGFGEDGGTATQTSKSIVGFCCVHKDGEDTNENGGARPHRSTLFFVDVHGGQVRALTCRQSSPDTLLTLVHLDVSKDLFVMLEKSESKEMITFHRYSDGRLLSHFHSPEGALQEYRFKTTWRRSVSSSASNLNQISIFAVNASRQAVKYTVDFITGKTVRHTIYGDFNDVTNVYPGDPADPSIVITVHDRSDIRIWDVETAAPLLSAHDIGGPLGIRSIAFVEGEENWASTKACDWVAPRGLNLVVILDSSPLVLPSHDDDMFDVDDDNEEDADDDFSDSLVLGISNNAEHHPTQNPDNGFTPSSTDPESVIDDVGTLSTTDAEVVLLDVSEALKHARNLASDSASPSCSHGSWKVHQKDQDDTLPAHSRSSSSTRQSSNQTPRQPTFAVTLIKYRFLPTLGDVVAVYAIHPLMMVLTRCGSFLVIDLENGIVLCRVDNIGNLASTSPNPCRSRQIICRNPVNGNILLLTGKGFVQINNPLLKNVGRMGKWWEV
ncbi:hypothetical protein HK102_002889 [Quaeritorhiza haematococci]|nr:hypothetical protein HK102_002889 [Quaeritorhiza haematococci]